MGYSSYSEVVKGARRPRQLLLQTCSGSTKAKPLAWEPSPASPSPLPCPSPPPLSPPLAFPYLAGHGNDVDGGLFQAHEPLMRRSWAAATRGTQSPSKSSVAFLSSHEHSNEDDEDEPDIVTIAHPKSPKAAEGMTFPLRARDREDLRVPPNLPKDISIPLPHSPPWAGSPSATRRDKQALWDNPVDADLIIRCRCRGGGDVHWKVHRRTLLDMSEWMKKYMPPAAEDGSVVEWELSSWDAGQLGAVLQYMYLGDFQGGVYDPNNPLNTESLLLNTVHFLAGTACLCRPMMDQAVTQIDDAIEKIQQKVPLLRLANIDEFEISIRRALLIMYDEPDQWRIRALRIVMGKMIAVCFPLILQSQRWVDTYQKWWGMMRVRVVADHKWLCQAGMCQKSNVIVSGFEHMDVLWVKYRKEGWQPSDDLMFPMQEVDNPPTPPASAPPTPAGGEKKSKAIPIVNPSGNINSDQAELVPRFTGKLMNCLMDEPTANSTCEGDKGKAKMSEQKTALGAVRSSAVKAITISTSDAPLALVRSNPSFEDPFTASSSPSSASFFHNPSAPPESAEKPAHISCQPQSVSALPFFLHTSPMMTKSLPVSPQRLQNSRTFSATSDEPSPVLPWLPDGPFYFAETSTGEPSKRFASEAAIFATPSVAEVASAMDSAAPSVISESHSAGSFAVRSVVEDSPPASAAASSIDPLDSPTRRMAELELAFDETDDGPVDQYAFPRATADKMSKSHEATEEQTISIDTVAPEDGATPRITLPQTRKVSDAAADQATTPAPGPATCKNKEAKKKPRRFDPHS